jgi:photosystem II stability/assembly factor-like uncharacterized protein
MKRIHTILILSFVVWMKFCLCQNLNAQQIIILDSCQKISLRGLSVVNNNIFWASGSKGTVGRTTNGGKKMKWIKVLSYEQRDFRDIESFDENNAIIMAIDSPAIILKTRDGGKSWKKVFEDNRNGMFLDALNFKNKNSGIVVGDPIDGRFFLARTNDGGEHWSTIAKNSSPIADSGEALFAASGTNVLLKDDITFFISGGKSSHLFVGDLKIKLPLLQGKSSTGANSMDISETGKIIIVGGDFSADSISYGNCAISDDNGKTFYMPRSSPSGYKSSIAYIGNNKWIACGTSGVDISLDDGTTWKNISQESFHVVQKAKKGNKIFLAGKNGRIAEILID